MSKFSDLPENTNPDGADIIAIEQDADGLNRKVQLDNLPIVKELASQANGEGASLVAIEDAAGNFTSTNVEGALAELAALMDGIDAWISGTTYTANEDVVILTDDNKIYRCIVTNSDVTFDPAKWITVGGGDGGHVKCDYYDPISTVLPTGTTVDIDGVTAVDGDRVLFSNLAVDNNKIYELSGVGVSLVWTPTTDFNLGVAEDGDIVTVLSGDGFREATGVFDGTEWKFNDNVRYYSGADYWELSSLKTSDILNNTTDNIFSVSLAGSENCSIEYSIFRGTDKETGMFIITSDGTVTKDAQVAANIGSVGVDLFSDIDSGNLRFRYTADSSGANGTIKYFVKRWSNTAGGPGGIPTYSGATGGSTNAAGNVSEIQYHGSAGFLDADSDFSWDESDKKLKLGGLDIDKLQGAFTINDNQAVPLTIITYDKVEYKYAIFEYSIQRGTENRVGRMLVTNNGTVASITDDSTDTGGGGISAGSIPFSASISGSNVIIQYTSDATGNTGNFKYTARRWQ